MATNRIDILDPALLRPGRIDRKIEFPPPNEEARLDILKIHSRKMNLTRGINLRKIAELMPGASGAEVKVYIYYPLIGFFLPSYIPNPSFLFFFSFSFLMLHYLYTKWNRRLLKSVVFKRPSHFVMGWLRSTYNT